MYNRIPSNYHLSNKKNLFENLSEYYQNLNLDPFDFIPETYLVTPDPEDTRMEEFIEYSESLKNPLWILKPGENSNRGRGIRLFTTTEELKALTKDNNSCVYVIQKYILNPLLIQK